jgi:hypothetical protein
LEQFAAPANSAEMAPEQRAAAFEQLIEGLPEMPVLSDEAMSRDAIYRRDDKSPR